MSTEPLEEGTPAVPRAPGARPEAEQQTLSARAGISWDSKRVDLLDQRAALSAPEARAYN